MALSRHLRNTHAQNYIREVFTEHLISAGFMCPDERLLCWYRIKNSDVINSVIFYSQYPNLPLQLCIGYGLFPSFQKPFYLQNVVCKDYPWNEEHFCEQSIIEILPYSATTYQQYSNDILVYAPNQGGRGLFTFENILLPAMDSINTLPDVYAYHKNRLENKPYAKDFGAYIEISKTFVTMVYLLNDFELFPVCHERISKAIELYKQLHHQFPKQKKYQEELAGWIELETVFQTKNREGFMDIIEMRKKENLRYLQEKMKITPV